MKDDLPREFSYPYQLGYLEAYVGMFLAGTTPKERLAEAYAHVQWCARAAYVSGAVRASVGAEGAR